VSAWLVFWFGLFAMMARGMLRARLRETNWLVRTQTNGLLIKFRSYLNYHFHEKDPVVVDIPYIQIEFVRAHPVRQTEPDSDRHGDVTKFIRYAELKVRNTALVKQLEERLAEERDRQAPQEGRLIRSRTKVSHYPLLVTNEGLVRIEWQVWPRLKKF